MKGLKGIVAVSLFVAFISILLFIALITSDENENMDFGEIGLNVSAEVMNYATLVEKYCKEFDISEYVNYVLAIMQVESGGKGKDVMQCSESLGLPPNTLETEESIKQGCYYFSKLLKSSLAMECDIDTAIQSYNFGGGFVSYVGANEKVYSFTLAEQFSKSRSQGIKVVYSNPIAVKMNGGWRYQYGNMFYVLLVKQYILLPHFDDQVVQVVMQEALKYQGWRYVFGGASPSTSFDCSGLTQWCYSAAGIGLPRTAQEQYEATQHIPLSQAKAGDLLFFHSTYDTANYITHVGIFVGNDKMYHAGDPIGYADIGTAYWKQHFVCAGRIKK